MEIIDAQIHSWEAETTRPWDTSGPGESHDGPAYTTEAVLAAMNAVGVDACVLSVSPSYRTMVAPGIPRFDNSYAEEAATRFPGRIASVARYHPRDPDLADLVANVCARPGTLGLRTTVFVPEHWRDWEAGSYGRLFALCQRHDVPLMLAVPGHPDKAGEVAAAYPELTLIVDHFALPQPPQFELDPDPFERLPRLLALAKFPNVAVKFGGAPTMSRQPYPFADLWTNLLRVVDAFGPDRLMWASDVTRCLGLHTYAEAVGYLRDTDQLSGQDKEQILGASLRRILRWPRNAVQAVADGRHH